MHLVYSALPSITGPFDYPFCLGFAFWGVSGIGHFESGISHLASHLAAGRWRVRHSANGPASKTRRSGRQGIVVGRDAPCLECVCHCFAAAALGLWFPGSLVPWFLGPISSGILRPVTACSRHGPVLTQANPLKPPIRSLYPSTVRPASPSSQRPSGHQPSPIVHRLSRIPHSPKSHIPPCISSPLRLPSGFLSLLLHPVHRLSLVAFFASCARTARPSNRRGSKTLLVFPHSSFSSSPAYPPPCRPLARLADSLCSSPPHQKNPQRVYHLGVSAASASCAM